MTDKFPGEADEPYFPGEDRPVLDEDDAAAKQRDEIAEFHRNNIVACMNQKWFREWMMERLVSFNTFGQTFAATPTGFPDPNATFFHLGMKAAGLAIWEELDMITPELAALMRREAQTPKA